MQRKNLVGCLLPLENCRIGPLWASVINGIHIQDQVTARLVNLLQPRFAKIGVQSNKNLKRFLGLFVQLILKIHSSIPNYHWPINMGLLEISSIFSAYTLRPVTFSHTISLVHDVSYAIYYTNIIHISITDSILNKLFYWLQVMQFGRIDGNAYTLDFQYPFSAIQAFSVALANVTQRLK